MKYYKLIIFLLLLVSFSFASLPFSFTEVAHYDPDNYSVAGKAYDVVRNNAYIFTAFGVAGIYVHQLVDSNLVYVSHHRDGENHQNLLIAADGSLLSAVKGGGVFAYAVNDGLLIEKTTLDTLVRTYRMVQGPDSTIYMANANHGLTAYRYNGKNFDHITSIDQGGSALGIAYRADSTLFLANDADGVRIYKFSGSEFLPMGRFWKGSYGYSAKDISLINDSTLVTCGIQLNVYNVEDSSLREEFGFYLPESNYDPASPYPEVRGERVVSKGDSIFVSIPGEGLFYYKLNDVMSKRFLPARQATSHGICLSEDLIFHSNEGMGVSVYNKDLELLDNFSMSEKALRLRKGSANTFYLASGIGGVKILRYNDGVIELINECLEGQVVTDIAVNSAETIVSSVNTYQGLKVYSNTHDALTLIHNQKFHANVFNAVDRATYYSTEISAENKLYFGYYYNYDDLIHDRDDYTAGIIRCYDVNANTITYNKNASYSFEDAQRPKGITSLNDGHIFVSFLTDGVKELTHDNSIDNGGKANAITVSSEGMVYLANGEGGLRSYTFDTSFSAIAHIDNGGYAHRVCSVGSNLALLANGVDGLRAYIHEDSLFTCKAHMDTEGELRDVIVLDDSTVIVADGYNGLTAYTFNGWNEILSHYVIKPIVLEYSLGQNFPNPFNPTTTIHFDLPQRTNVNMIIHDLSGRSIRKWSYENLAMGLYDIVWDGKDHHGNPVPSGMYIYTLVAGDHVESKKMVLLK